MSDEETLNEAIEDARIIRSLVNYVNYNAHFRFEDKQRVSRILEKTIEDLDREVEDIRHYLSREQVRLRVSFELLIAVILEDIERVRECLKEKEVDANFSFIANERYVGYHTQAVNKKYESLNLPQHIRSNKTCLMYAAASDNLELFKLLLENGADLVVDGERREMSAIATAVECSSKNVLEYLHQEGQSEQISREIMKLGLKKTRQ